MPKGTKQLVRKSHFLSLMYPRKERRKSSNWKPSWMTAIL
jgi:hypothetical protein